MVAVFAIILGVWGAGAALAGVSVTTHGAAGEVGGSLAILEVGDAKYMIDCGLYYGGGEEPGEKADARIDPRNQRLPAGATAVDAVVVTHAHLDHIGRLPLLVRQGFSGPIYLTEASAQIARVMLAMQILYDADRVRDWVWSRRSERRDRQVVLHWMPCEWSAKIKERGARRGRLAEFESTETKSWRPCKVCAELEMEATARLFRICPEKKQHPLGPDVVFEFLGAGHIPGSVSVLFSIGTESGPRRVLFSGDLGNDLSPLFEGPSPAPAADLVLLEATYGAARRASDVAGEFEEFRREVGRTVAAGGVAWIPAFALDRTQKILNQLVRAEGEGTMPPGPSICCPSPSASQITAIYQSAAEARRGWFRGQIEGKDSSFRPRGLDGRCSALERIRGGDHPGPCVLITTSGMMDAASSRSLLSALLPDAHVGVFLVGWQDPMSPGGQIQKGNKSILVGDQRIPVRARIHEYKCFSGHGDARDIDEWLASVPRSSPLVLVHGDPDGLAARKGDLESKGWSRVLVAAPGARIDVH